MKLMQFQIDDIIKTALLEDINYIDVTTDYLVDENSVSTAKYVSKDEGVLCGIDVAMRVFQLLDSNVKCEIFIHDGEKVKSLAQRRKNGTEYRSAYVRRCNCNKQMC